jgi:hypothetical protein
MQSNGSLDLISTSQRVPRNSTDKEREGVFSSSKLCSLYDKVLEVTFCIASASTYYLTSIFAQLGLAHSINFYTQIQDNFECRMRASRRRTQRAFGSRGCAPDALQAKAL